MKKILLGLLVVSAVSMATSEVKPVEESPSFASKLSHRIGINYDAKGSERWSSESKAYNSKNKIFDDSMGFNYKLLYNVTDRFRWGGEVGYLNTRYTDELKNSAEVDSNVGSLMLGVAVEYDIYSGESVSIYVNASGGLSIKETTHITNTIQQDNATMKKQNYAKLGSGLRLNSGLGIEVGGRVERYRYKDFDNDKDVSFTRVTPYFELNYSF